MAKTMNSFIKIAAEVPSKLASSPKLKSLPIKKLPIRIVKVK